MVMIFYVFLMMAVVEMPFMVVVVVVIVALEKTGDGILPRRHQ